MPSRPGPSISTNNDGTISINYTPKETGNHEMTISYNEQLVEGNPPIKATRSGMCLCKSSPLSERGCN